MINFLLRIPYNAQIEDPLTYFRYYPSSARIVRQEKFTLMLWGDPIIDKDFNLGFSQDSSVQYLIKNLRGHYYYLIHNRINGEINLGNSLFSILPVYYKQDGSDVFISNDPLRLASKDKGFKLNKRFILENILFNYSLFNQSCIEGVMLLPTNHYVHLKQGLMSAYRHSAIEDYFVNTPRPWRKSTEHIAELFIRISKQYFPDEHYAASLTAGLDGRALTACARYHKKEFETYAFGSLNSQDIHIASVLSKKADLRFNPIYLDEDYIKRQSLDCGLSFIRGANGEASFSRAHYLYAAKKLSEKTKYIITGNFGSEILRATHTPGVTINLNLCKCFFAKNFDKAIKEIHNSSEFNWLNKDAFKLEWESLMADIKTLPCFNPKFKYFTKNQQFYILVFEETLRKYFGAEMVNQYQYLANRTPFLDYEFIKAILQTQLAGVYSDFFTHNPLKRYKGQVLYSYIIQKTFPAFVKEITDKGYRPIDLLSFTGKLYSAMAFVKKRIKRKKLQNADSYSVIAAYKHNRHFFEKIKIREDFFNVPRFKKAFKGGFLSKDSFFIALSQAWWQNELGLNYEQKT